MEETRQETKRKSVLIGDDDPLARRAASAVLESRYEVRTASNGREALKMVAVERPDLIVLDVMMDYVSEGFDVARTLRADPQTQSIPLILLTAVDEGLGACFFGVPGPRHDAVLTAFGVPPNRRIVGVISLGLPAADRRSPSLRRGRRPFADVVHDGRFGAPFPARPGAPTAPAAPVS